VIDPAVLRSMLDAGCSAEQIVAVAEDAARALEEKKAAKRAGAAERQRRFRERNALSRVTDVTNGDAVSPKKEIPPTPPKEKTTPSNSKANAFSVCDEKFAEFWIAYPRREGPNPRKPAKLIFDRLVARGVGPQRLIDAAKALAVEHPTPTRFIPQATTFLNQERFDDEAPLLTGNEFCAEDWPNTRILVARFKQEHQTDPPRAVNGGKAGYLIPAEWVAISKQQRAANA
jgi:hypothetical protein